MTLQLSYACPRVYPFDPRFVFTTNFALVTMRAQAIGEQWTCDLIPRIRGETFSVEMLQAVKGS
jgi:hypothetical protein